MAFDLEQLLELDSTGLSEHLAEVACESPNDALDRANILIANVALDDPRIGLVLGFLRQGVSQNRNIALDTTHVLQSLMNIAELSQPDSGYREEATTSFESVMNEFMTDDPDRAYDAAFALKAKAQKTGPIYPKLMSRIISNLKADKPLGIVNIADSADELTQDQRALLLSKIPDIYNDNPYQVLHALRLFIESIGYTDCPVVKRAQEIFDAYKNDPAVLAAILKEEYGEMVRWPTTPVQVTHNTPGRA